MVAPVSTGICPYRPELYYAKGPDTYYDASHTTLCEFPAFDAPIMASDPQDIAAELANIFVQPVIIRMSAPLEVDITRLDARIILKSVREKRQREFAAGRFAASEAIEKLTGHPAFPGIGPSREPVWPDGVVGSITHTNSIAFAGVTDSECAKSLGLDVEELQTLDAGFATTILTVREAKDTGSRDEDVLKLFSYKEALFKCVFPVFGKYIDFKDVEIRKTDTGLRAAAVDRNHRAADIINRVRGDSKTIGKHVVSACWLPV